MSDGLSTDLIRDCTTYLQANPTRTAAQLFDDFAVAVSQADPNSIPVISPDTTIPTGHLCRFRGMVSNQLNVEYYVHSTEDPSSQAIKCHAFSQHRSADLSTEQFYRASTVTRQRLPVLVKPVPGETKWYTELSSPKSFCHSDTSFKQGVLCLVYAHESSLRICEEVELFGLFAPAISDPILSDSPKIPVDSEEKSEVLKTEDVDMSEVSTDDASATAAEDEAEECFADDLPVFHVLYHRTIEQPSKDLGSRLLLSMDETTTDSSAEGESLSSMRPRLIEFIAWHFEGDSLTAEFVLLNLLSSVISRDSGCLIGSFCLGILGLGHSELEKQKRMDRITNMYELLMPRVKKVSLSVSNLNDHQLVPVKNHRTQELECGKDTFQFVDGTVVLLDQTCLLGGSSDQDSTEKAAKTTEKKKDAIGTPSNRQLNSTGVLNLRALKELIQDQKVTYDFEFHGLPFLCDCPVLLIQGERARMGFQAHFTIPSRDYHGSIGMQSIREDREEMEDEHEGSAHQREGDEDADVRICDASWIVGEKSDDGSLKWTDHDLNVFRRFIYEAKKRVRQFELTPEISKKIEVDFVQRRKRDKEIGADSLHLRMTLLRLANASLLLNDPNDGTVCDEAWDLVCRIESKRELRLRKCS